MADGATRQEHHNQAGVEHCNSSAWHLYKLTFGRVFGKYQSCARESEEKEKRIRSLDLKMSKEKMYKEFFHSVVKQLRNFNNSDLDLEIRLSTPEMNK